LSIRPDLSPVPAPDITSSPSVELLARTLNPARLPSGARRLRIFLAGYSRTASGYYRCCIPGAMLQGHADVVFRDELSQAQWVEALKWADVVVLERDAQEGMSRMIESLQADGKAVAMDIDDDVHNFKSVPNKVVADFWTSNLSYLVRNAKAVDGITVTTRRLQAHWASVTGRSVFYLPNQIDSRNPRWQFEREKLEGKVVIGYMGGATHSRDLLEIRPAIEEILKKYPQAVFKMVGPDELIDWIQDLPQGQVIHDKGYSPVENYPSRMRDFDIGIIPIEKNNFNRAGKSDLKVLEMGILGIPVVATRFLPYSETVLHKRTGFLADGPEEWVYWLGRLVEDESLRLKVGGDLRAWVLGQREASLHVEEWLRAFHQIYLRRQKKYRKAS
jgi:hypothetical protein